MQLPGRLGSTTLGDVLGSLYRGRVSGVLELLEDSGVKHAIHLLGGQVTEVDTRGAAPKLGELLEQLGSMDADRRREVARCSLEELNQRLGSVLLQKRLVTRDELRAALRIQNNARLERLYALRDARILFRVARQDELERASLSAEEVLEGRPRARDGRRPPAREFGTERLRDARGHALAVLGLDRDADEAAIHRAFRRLASKLHPDRNSEASFKERAQSIREFSRLSAAYHQLVA